MDLEALPAPHLPPGTVRLLDHRPAADRLSFLLPSRGPSPREAARSCLLEWLHAEGARFFPPLLDALADETGIPRPSRVRIGRPRTRWASRSSSGTISCSVLLLFLPRDLLVHVLLHELAHVAHMNHGAAFHAHLARLDPLSSVHEKALRAAERNYVPAWVRD